LQSNSTAAESTGTTVIQAFSGMYVYVGTDNSVNAHWRQTYVGWQWKEGATQGFDIVTYTGDGSSCADGAHSLGVAPSMMIVKSRTTQRQIWLEQLHTRLLGQYRSRLTQLRLQKQPALTGGTTPSQHHRFFYHRRKSKYQHSGPSLPTYSPKSQGFPSSAATPATAARTGLLCSAGLGLDLCWLKSLVALAIIGSFMIQHEIHTTNVIQYFIQI
jgi:hypothetical protein